MTEYKDYYQILGLTKNASDEEIKKSYRQLAKQFHPDINKSIQAEKRFKEISEAYNVLSNAEKKRQYDTLGNAFSQGFDPRQSGSQGGFGFGRSGGASQDFGNLNDLFSELFNMGGIRTESQRRSGHGFSSARGRQVSPVVGKNIISEVDIEFIESINGTSRTFSLPNSKSQITVKIPAGVNNGSKVRVAGKGEAGLQGGKSGDLYLEIRVRPHPVFWREGKDILCEMPITFYESSLGGSISVPTIDGPASMKLPKCTKSGQKFRLKGKGAPVLDKSGAKGDQYVIVQVVPPKKLSKEEEKMMQRWQEEFSYNPRS